MELPFLELTFDSMKGMKLLAAWVVAFCILQMRGLAQDEYQFFLRGIANQTNSAGKFITTRVTDQTLLKDIAQAAGITDIKSIMLVYHVNGSDFGDTVDVVNSKTGEVLDTVFGLYFGNDAGLGRMILNDATGTEERRIDYIYTKQDSHSLGSAFVTKRRKPDRKGNTTLTVQGTIQYLVTSFDGSVPKIITGTFNTGKLQTFSGAH